MGLYPHLEGDVLSRVCLITHFAVVTPKDGGLEWRRIFARDRNLHSRQESVSVHLYYKQRTAILAEVARPTHLMHLFQLSPVKSTSAQRINKKK